MNEIISSIRDFNRFYIQLTGIMKNRFPDLNYSFTELRTVFEISNTPQITARDIKDKLPLDEGYVSRIVKKLVKDKIITREQSSGDKRTYFLTLTEKGHEVAALINERSDKQIESILTGLDQPQKTRVVKLMKEIKSILSHQQAGSISFVSARSPAEFEEGKKLFNEYSDSLPFKLDFQGFEKELELIHGKYAHPEGALILCLSDEKPVGCVGVRKISDGIAELKRLYVKPEYRALKIGGKLMELALDEARQLGYDVIRLDTVTEMQAAIRLYKKLGFYEIEAYCYNPIETVIYMEKRL